MQNTPAKTDNKSFQWSINNRSRTLGFMVLFR